MTKTDVMTHIDNPKYYSNKVFYDFAKIESVSIDDLSFVGLLDVIRKITGVNNISFTTGPKRGEIVWNTELKEYNDTKI